MNALGIGLVVVLAPLILLAPRRWALAGMMAGVLYLTQQQSIQVLGLNLTAMRLLELAGFVRIAIRREFEFSTFNRIDGALVALYAYTTAVFLLRSDVGRAEAIGTMVDAMLCYFTFRALIRDIAGLEWFLRSLVLLLIPYIALLVIESTTQRNPFAVFGALTWDDLRGSRLRAMGSFRNPSLLGTLGACFLPLYAAFFFMRRTRSTALVGIGLCIGIVLLSNSGGPIGATATGGVGWLCWVMRKRMHVVRRLLAGAIVLLLLVMNAPIWYVLERISFVSGGSGWHRSHLLDMAFRDLGQWWLAGMGLERTRDWFPYTLAITGAADITNTFVAFGLSGGLPAMALLILMLARAFGALGRSLETVRRARGARDAEFVLWGLGCVLLVHVVTWLGITYFDQSYVVWFMQLAAISSISFACSRKAMPGTVVAAPGDRTIGRQRSLVGAAGRMSPGWGSCPQGVGESHLRARIVASHALPDRGRAT
jgi:hypothetical protein